MCLKQYFPLFQMNSFYNGLNADQSFVDFSCFFFKKRRWCMSSFKVLARLKGGHVWLRLRSILPQSRFSFEVICLSAAVWCVTFTVIHLYFYTSILLLLYWVLNTFLNLVNLLLKKKILPQTCFSFEVICFSAAVWPAHVDSTEKTVILLFFFLLYCYTVILLYCYTVI